MSSIITSRACADSSDSQETPAFRSFRVLGSKIDAVNHEQALAVIDRWIRERHRDYIVLAGAHIVVEMQKNAQLLDITNHAGLTTADGMPIVWVGRLKGFRDVEKITSDILVATISSGVEKGYRHFFYGGAQGVAERLAAKLIEQHPGMIVAGCLCPPFRGLSQEESQVVADYINRRRPDVVWVGLGCPKQELWMAHFRPMLDAPVLVGVGAAFDFFSGAKLMAPSWISHLGFEWLFRLACEPRRLWKRYAKILPLLPAYLIEEKLGLGVVGRRARSQAASPVVRHSRSSDGPLGDHDGILCFGGVDWWYHNHGYLVIQILKRLAPIAPVLFVNSFGFRMPSLSERSVFFRRVLRKARSVAHPTTQAFPGFWVASPLSFPLWHHRRLARWNVDSLTWQVKAACRKAGLHHPLIWAGCPTSCEVVKRIRSDNFLIYERTDKYEAYSSQTRDYIREANSWFLANADLTIYAGAALQEEERGRARSTLLLNHAVDTSHFDPQLACATRCPDDLEGIPKPIVGFIGEVDEDKVDLNLLADTARAFPQASFVLVGQVTANPSPVAALPNVHLLGGKSFEAVPRYGARFDVAIMPWKQTEWVRYLSPIKLKEYLSLKLPVVVMPFAEAEHYREVMYVADGSVDFIHGVGEALAGRGVGTPEGRRQVVLSDTWEKAAVRILEEIGRLSVGRR